VGVAVEAGTGDDAGGAGGDAVRAAVADVGLDVDVVGLVVEDGPGRARLLTGGDGTVLANVAHHQPARGCGPTMGQHFQREPLGGRLGRAGAVGELLDEVHVPPGCAR